jgi:hypothetical protein
MLSLTKEPASETLFPVCTASTHIGTERLRRRRELDAELGETVLGGGYVCGHDESSSHIVDVARPGRQPKRCSALMISATAAGTICSQEASPPWIRARTSGVRIDR